MAWVGENVLIPCTSCLAYVSPSSEGTLLLPEVQLVDFSLSWGCSRYTFSLLSLSFFFFSWCWELNSGPHTYLAFTLPLSYTPNFHLLILLLKTFLLHMKFGDDTYFSVLKFDTFFHDHLTFFTEVEKCAVRLVVPLGVIWFLAKTSLCLWYSAVL